MRKSDQNEVKDELLKMGSELRPGKHHCGYQTPDNYFETLPNAIQDRIIQAKTRKRVIFSASHSWRSSIAIAAIVMFIALTVSLFLLKNEKENGHYTEIYDSYLIENLISFSDLDPLFFYEMVLESDLSTDEILFGAYNGNELNDNHVLFDYVNSLMDYHWFDAETLLITDN
jgi:hypothetical protein